jgi:hypothetical protein
VYPAALPDSNGNCFILQGAAMAFGAGRRRHRTIRQPIGQDKDSGNRKENGPHSCKPLSFFVDPMIAA